MNSQPPRYKAYLLRLWTVNDGSAWRASLEDAHTGERLGFATLERLFAFVQAQCANEIDPAPSQERPQP